MYGMEFSRAFGTNAREMRYYANNIEGQRGLASSLIKPPHIRPDSICVAAIGINWEPGAWQKTVDMVYHTNKSGVCCWFTEMADNNLTLPFSAISAMRDAACLYVSDLGFEWLLLVENDVLPEPDLALRLLDADRTVVSPYMWDENLDHSIAYPNYERNTGVQPIKWTALSCILIWTKVLNCYPSNSPFTNMIAEGEFFGRLTHYGHRAYQDTGTELKLATMPSYAGDHIKSLQDLWASYEKLDTKRRNPPDRRPIDPNDKRDSYVPIAYTNEMASIAKAKREGK